MPKETETYTSIRNFPFPILQLDADFSILDYSNTVFDIFELDSKKTGDSDSDTYLPEIPFNFRSIFQDRVFVKNEVEHVTLHVTRNNELKWLKLKLNPSGDKATSYLRIEDITKEKVSLDLASRVERVARIGSWEVDLINNTIFWSDMTKEIHEVPKKFQPDLEKGINFYKEGHHRERIIELVSDAIENGQSFDEEFIIVTGKGNELWVRSIGQAEFVNGKCSRIFGVFLDIHKSMVEAEHLKTLTNRMSIAVESANIGIWDFNIKDNELIWDENMYKLYGVEKNNFSGDYDAWENTLHPDDKERCVKEVSDAIAGIKDFNSEFRIIQADDSIKHITGMARVFRDKNGNAVRMVGANTDVTSLKKTHERLRNLLRVTKRQNESLLNFAHIVSHNLRSNSSNLLMLSEALVNGVDSEKSKELIEMIRTSSKHLDQTVVQLNEVLKIGNDEDRKFEVINVHEGIRAVIQSINSLLEESGAEINIDVPESLSVFGIRPYFNSVLLNLLTNSIKYKSNQRKLKIDVLAKANSEGVVLKFTDNGIGIDLERFGHKIFGLHGTFHENSDANGIGLFIVKNQMESMNGAIDVESEVERGTTFKLKFQHKRNE